MEIWNHVFMQDQVDAHADVVGDASGEEHRHRLVARACRDGAARDEELLRHRSVHAAARGGRVAVGQALRLRRAQRHLDQDHRRARSGDGVPDRRRRAAVERGARLHPATHAAAGRVERAAARGRGRGDAAARRGGGRGVRRGVSGARREPGVHRAGRSARRRSGSAPRCARAWCCSRKPAGVPRAAASGRRRVQALRHVRLPDRADRGAGGRGGARPSTTGFPRAAGGAAGQSARRGEEGARSGSTPVPCRRPSSSATTSRRPTASIAMLLGDDRGQLDVAAGGGGGVGLPRPHAVLRGVRRAGGRRGRDPDAHRHDPRARRAVGRPDVDHAHRRGELRRGAARAGRDRGDRPAAPRGDRARPHVDPRRALDLEAHPRRARPSGRLARRPRPAAVRLPAPGLGAREVLEQAELEANRLLARDDAANIFETSMDEAKALGAIDAVRREVRRHGAGGRDRRLLARALRRHPRGAHGPHRRGPHPARGLDRFGDAPGRGARRARRPA